MSRQPLSPVLCQPLEDRRLLAAHAQLNSFGPLSAIEQQQVVELSATITNIGDVPLESYRLRWQLSTDQSLDEPDDIILETRNVSAPLAAGATRTTRRTVTIPVVPPGAYFLLVSVQDGLGFHNEGTSTPILSTSTDFRVTELDLSPHTLNLQEAFNFEWSADIHNQGLSRALAEWDAILSRDRTIGNGDDVVLEGEGLPFLDLLPDQTGILSDFESIIGSATPSGSYYFGMRVINTTDPTPNNNVFVTAKPIISVIGDSDTDGVFTMRGGAGLDSLITHDVAATRASGTGFGPIQETGETKVHTFEISNDGAMPLQILSVEGRGQHPDDFTISDSFTTAIAAGSTRTYTVTFDPTDFATRRANFLFTTNDPNRENFRMRIAGQGDAPASAPDIHVFGADPDTGTSAEISHNDRDPEAADGTDFGLLGDGPAHTFEIRNTGGAPLEFRLSPDGVSSIRAASGEAANTYEFGRNNANNRGFLSGVPESLDPGESMTFVVEFRPLAFGNYKPWVEIYTNDPDMPMFRFRVRGTQVP